MIGTAPEWGVVAEVPANDAAPAAPAPASPFPAMVVDAEEVGCDHLAPFSFTFDTPIRQGVHCFVQFSTHCFSDRYDPGRHPENIVVVDERGQMRCFDRDRYELSKGLEALIRSLPGSKIYQTPESNFAIITAQDGREYRVFFNVRRDAKKKVRLYVESAYPPDAERLQVVPATNFQKVRFVALIDKVLSNEKLVFKGR
jgi:hypothetical protein